MTDLLSQLESATEGSRGLDAHIHIALVNPRVLTNPGDHRGDGVEWKPASEAFTEGWDFREAAALMGCPRYTTNLQDAVSLAGNDWLLINATSTQLQCHAVMKPDRPGPEGWGATPALALCIAIIKAQRLGQGIDAHD